MAANKDSFRILHSVSVAPSKIKLTEKFQGRHKPVADEEVIALADTLRREGQQQPLQVRGIKGTDTVEAVFGNTRQRAGMLIENGYKDNAGKDVKADPNFVLRCEVVDISDENAFIGNLVENVHRNATTMVDNYDNQKVLREEHNMSDAAIARLYGINQAMITRTKKLATFDTDELRYILDAVHAGECTFTAAVTLSEAKDVIDAGDEAIGKVWAKRKEDAEGVFSQGRMLEAIKEYREEVKAEAAKSGTDEGSGTGEGTGTGEGGGTGESTATGRDPTKTYARTVKEIRELFSCIAAGKRTPEPIILFSNKMLDMVAGKVTSDELGTYLCDQFGVSPLTDEEVTIREAERAAEAAKVTAEAEKLAAEAKAKAAAEAKAKSDATPAAGVTVPATAPATPTQPITPERDANNAPKKKGGKGAKAGSKK